MHTIVIGLNHKTAGVEMREKCNFASDKLSEAFHLLKTYKAINGAVILSTCNRVEVYASTNDIGQGFEAVTDFMASYHAIDKDLLDQYLYKKNCEQAVMHLFKVAAGIDSMVVGEYQIQGQMRDAYHAAYSLNQTDGVLNKLFQSAINTGKRVRTETEIGKGHLSVAHLAVELIKKIFPHKLSFDVLLVGAGKMAKLTADNLKQLHDCKVMVANRSVDNATELAKQFGGDVVAFDDRYECLHKNEIVIVSTNAEAYTIEYDKVQKIMESNPSQTKLFIDLSIPRNIDPTINQIDNCMVYSIDDINKIIDLNVNKRTQEIDKAESILEEVSEDFYNWYYKQILMPTMHDLKNKLEVLKTKTIEGYKAEFSTMSDPQQQLARDILDAYSDRFIKLIMKNLAAVTAKEDIIHIVDSFKKSFRIEDIPGDESTMNHPPTCPHHHH